MQNRRGSSPSSSGNATLKYAAVGVAATVAVAGLVRWWLQSRQAATEAQDMFTDEALATAKAAVEEHENQPVFVVHESELEAARKRLIEKRKQSPSKKSKEQALEEIADEEADHFLGDDGWETEDDGENSLDAISSDEELEAQAAVIWEQELRKEWKQLVKRRQDRMSSGQKPNPKDDARLEEVSHELDELRIYREEQLQKHGVDLDQLAKRSAAKGVGPMANRLPFGAGGGGGYNDEDEDDDAYWNQPGFDDGEDGDGWGYPRDQHWTGDDYDEEGWMDDEDDDGQDPFGVDGDMSDEQKQALLQLLMGALSGQQSGGYDASADDEESHGQSNHRPGNPDPVGDTMRDYEAEYMAKHGPTRTHDATRQARQEALKASQVEEIESSDDEGKDTAQVPRHKRKGPSKMQHVPASTVEAIDTDDEGEASSPTYTKNKTARRVVKVGKSHRKGKGKTTATTRSAVKAVAVPASAAAGVGSSPSAQEADREYGSVELDDSGEFFDDEEENGEVVHV